MLKRVITVAVITFAVIAAGYTMGRDIDWETVDLSGTPITPSASDRPTPGVLYVKCEIDGSSSVMTEKDCATAKRRVAEMSR